MKVVNGCNVRDAFQKQIRVYLCGKLSKQESFEHINTDGLEIGVSHYSEYTAEKAHLHKWNYEYNLVKSGSVKVYSFDEEKEYEFHQDDMYEIKPNMRYITKALSGTEVIFIKTPGGNDKELLPVTDAIINWGKDWNSKIINNGNE